MGAVPWNSALLWRGNGAPEDSGLKGSTGAGGPAAARALCAEAVRTAMPRISEAVVLGSDSPALAVTFLSKWWKLGQYLAVSDLCARGSRCVRLRLRAPALSCTYVSCHGKHVDRRRFLTLWGSSPHTCLPKHVCSQYRTVETGLVFVWFRFSINILAGLSSSNCTPTGVAEAGRSVHRRGSSLKPSGKPVPLRHKSPFPGNLAGSHQPLRGKQGQALCPFAPRTQSPRDTAG